MILLQVTAGVCVLYQWVCYISPQWRWSNWLSINLISRSKLNVTCENDLSLCLPLYLFPCRPTSISIELLPIWFSPLRTIFQYHINFHWLTSFEISPTFAVSLVHLLSCQWLKPCTSCVFVDAHISAPYPVRVLGPDHCHIIPSNYYDMETHAKVRLIFVMLLLFATDDTIACTISRTRHPRRLSQCWVVCFHNCPCGVVAVSLQRGWVSPDGGKAGSRHVDPTVSSRQSHLRLNRGHSH